MTPLVTCLDHARVRGGLATIECEQMPLGDALERAWPSDAHAQLATSSRFRRRRLTSGDIGRMPIELRAIAFDFDTAGHAPVTPAWRAQFAERATAAAPGCFIYFTRGGARIVGQLLDPFAIGTELDARMWRARYAAKCDDFMRFGLEPDRSCADWTRLFRLPHAARDGGAPEAWPTMGDLHAIGVIDLPEAPAAKLSPRAASTPLAKRERSERARPEQCMTPPPLLEALRSAGLVVGPGPAPGSLRIICPRDLAHTTGTPGDGSTIYYAPRDYCGSGAIHCKHGHCDAIRTARQWRRSIASYSGHRGSLRSPLAGGAVS